MGKSKQFPDVVVSTTNGKVYSCRLLLEMPNWGANGETEYIIEDYRGWSACRPCPGDQIIKLKAVF